MPDPNIFFWIAATVADAAIVHPNGIRTLLANGVSLFFINGKSTFINGPRSIPGNSPNCTMLDKRVFDNFSLAYESIKKSKYWFHLCAFTFDWYLFQLIMHLNSDLSCRNGFTLSSVDKVTTRT